MRCWQYIVGIKFHVYMFLLLLVVLKHILYIILRLRGVGVRKGVVS